MEDDMFKILIVGDINSGKTSIAKRYTSGNFDRNYKATIGVDFAVKHLVWADSEIEQSKQITIQLWDIAGQDRYSSMTRIYYKGAFAAIIVFDITRSETFENVIKWKGDLDEKVRLPPYFQEPNLTRSLGLESDPITSIVVANKLDLIAELSDTDPEKLRQIVRDSPEHQEYAEELDDWVESGLINGWYATSAMDNYGIVEMCYDTVGHIIKSIEGRDLIGDTYNSVSLDATHAPSKDACPC